MKEQCSIRLGAGAFVLLLLAVPLLSTSGFAAGSSGAGIMVPLYTYPGGTWDQVIETKNDHPDVPIAAIVNPASGPGSGQDSNYASGIARLQSAGVIVLGYVSTAYTNRDLSAVKADMDSWNSWYPDVDGIFFDEQTNWAGQEWYYEQADSYAKSKGFTFTVGNPGANSLPSYLGTVDVVLIYESPGLPYLSNYQSWSSADNNKLGMIPFGVGSMPQQWVEDASELVGWIYVTNDVLPNPWDSLPPYFDELASQLDDGSTPAPAPEAQEHTLTIRSLDQNGNAFDGMWMEVKKGGATVSTGFTPLTVTLEESTYTVSASNYQDIIFDHWSDGTTSSSISVDLSRDTALTAHYGSGAQASSLSLTLSASTASADAGSSVSFKASIQGGASPYEWSVNFGDGTSSPFGSGEVSKTYTAAGTYSAVATARDSQGATSESAPVAVSISPAEAMLTVKTVDSNGAPIEGYYTTLSQNGDQLESAFSPALFALSAGQSYQVAVSDYGDYVFSHWDDGSTSRTRTVSIDGPSTITAHYGSEQASLTIDSVDLEGKSISGLWTVIEKDGTTVSTGFTPMTFNGQPGPYEVTVANYQNYAFDHWESGSTSSTREVTLGDEEKVTAYYSTGSEEVTLTVRSAGLDGSPVTGLWTVISHDGSTATGFTPIRYTGDAGERYTITVADYRNYIFDHWDSGSTSRARTLTPDGDRVLTAYYEH